MIDGDFFADTYCHYYKPKRFLFIICHESNGSPIDYLLDAHKDKLNLFDIETINHWCIPVKEKWVRSLRKFTVKRISGLYSTLCQYLTEDGIKKYFYDVWLQNHNYQQRKSNIFEMNQLNYLRKRGLLPQKTDSTIVHITTNMKMREASKLSI